jgi:hypothetical protein
MVTILLKLWNGQTVSLITFVKEYHP